MLYVFLFFLSKRRTSQSWLNGKAISGSSSSSMAVGAGEDAGEDAGVGGVGGTSLPCKRLQFLIVNLIHRSSGCD